VIPAGGLLVSNHLGYLDVLVLSAITPAVFVAKREIRNWPLVGLLASLAGTLFVDRERRVQVGRMNDDIQVTLAAGALVVLFAEGTSSNGQTVLPLCDQRGLLLG
jgi:1-acyl-sn-glycerol-3-phosphate acyltransferase